MHHPILPAMSMHSGLGEPSPDLHPEVFYSAHLEQLVIQVILPSTSFDRCKIANHLFFPDFTHVLAAHLTRYTQFFLASIIYLFRAVR
jgi:hypothetical protein